MSKYLSQTLSLFTNRLTYQDLPAEVIYWVKMNLFDSLGIYAFMRATCPGPRLSWS